MIASVNWTAEALKECRVVVVSGRGSDKRVSFNTSAEYELTALLLLSVQMGQAVLDLPVEERIEGEAVTADGERIGHFLLKAGKGKQGK